MKSFTGAYNISKEEVRATRAAIIEQERAELVAAVKREYGIDSFNDISSADRKKYRGMILEMWSQDKGMNDKGKRFLAEGAVACDPSKALKKMFAANAETKLAPLDKFFADLMQKVEKECGKMKTGDAKAEFAALVSNYIKKIKI